MDIREAFEKVWPCPELVQFHGGRYIAADGTGLFLNEIHSRMQQAAGQQGRWEAWQHLYPMFEEAFREGYEDGFKEHIITGDRRVADAWWYSTTKARLEGE